MPEEPVWKQVSRQQARQVGCPACKAKAGTWCYTTGYRDGTVELRPSCHIERHEEAKARGAHRSFTVANTTTPRQPKPARPARPSRWAGLEPATKEEIMATPCPECDARPGQWCQFLQADGSRKARKDHHHQRYGAAMARLGRFPAERRL